MADESDDDALTAQGIAGEILDTALEHCRRGEREQALAMLRAIREQLDPPAGIQRVVQTLEASGCNGSLLNDVKGLRVQIGGGWDSNVSQGIAARTLTISPGGTPIELVLDDSYRPKSSAYAQAGLDYTLPLPWGGLVARGSFGHRQNQNARAFDLSSAGVGLSREFRVGGTSLRAQGEHTQIWLGGLHFQRNYALGLQWLGSMGANAWLAHAAATRSDYLTQPSQDSRQYETGLLVERRLVPAVSVYSGLTVQYDRAAGQRAGGDRKGFHARAGALVIAYGWQWRPQVMFTRWNSTEPFAPGLIDEHRHNRLQQVVLQAEKPLSQQMSLLVELNGRWARDTIPLYTYKAQAVTTSVAYRF